MVALVQVLIAVMLIPVAFAEYHVHNRYHTPDPPVHNRYHKPDPHTTGLWISESITQCRVWKKEWIRL
ncbi:hypothetical protein BASA81_013859 [Batrachochytrium salamandrivorans]|nr:hypothetical protein BASA81_013859 [Batrachochytrium salamandrivorans]